MLKTLSILSLSFVIVFIASCVSDDKIDKAAAECRTICDTLIEEKITEIETLIEGRCLTVEELLEFLYEIDYDRIYDEIEEIHNRKCDENN